MSFVKTVSPSLLLKRYTELCSNAPHHRRQGVSMLEFRQDLIEGDAAELVERIQGKDSDWLPNSLVLEEKADGSLRQIEIPAWPVHLTSLALKIHLATQVHLSSHFFSTPGRGVHDAIQRFILARRGHYVCVADIEKCYRSALRTCAKQSLSTFATAEDVELAMSLLTVPVEDEHGQLVEKQGRGLPQGNPLSPLVMAAILHKLPQQLKSIVVDTLIYVDDIALICRSESDADDALARLREALDDLGLRLNSAKIKVSAPHEKVLYLGHEIREEDGSILVKPPSKTMATPTTDDGLPAPMPGLPRLHHLPLQPADHSPATHPLPPYTTHPPLESPSGNSIAVKCAASSVRTKVQAPENGSANGPPGETWAPGTRARRSVSTSWIDAALENARQRMRLLTKQPAFAAVDFIGQAPGSAAGGCLCEQIPIELRHRPKLPRITKRYDSIVLDWPAGLGKENSIHVTTVVFDHLNKRLRNGGFLVARFCAADFETICAVQEFVRDRLYRISPSELGLTDTADHIFFGWRRSSHTCRLDNSEMPWLLFDIDSNRSRRSVVRTSWSTTYPLAKNRFVSGPLARPVAAPYDTAADALADKPKKLTELLVIDSGAGLNPYFFGIDPTCGRRHQPRSAELADAVFRLRNQLNLIPHVELVRAKYGEIHWESSVLLKERNVFDVFRRKELAAPLG